MKSMKKRNIDIHDEIIPLFILIFVSLILILFAWNTIPLRFSVGDAVAQFMPQSMQGYRSIKDGVLPLFNFYQFQGMPLIELGYFPVLYPITFISFAFAQRVLGNIQLAWDVLGFMQVFINILCGYFFLRYTLRVSRWLSVCGGLSLGFLGITFLQGAEWFYSNTAIGFVPLCLFFFDRLVRTPKPFYAIFLSLTFIAFWFSTNINIFFYAIHFIAGFGALILIQNYSSIKPNKKYFWFYLALSVVIIALGIFPSFLGIWDYSKESLREVGKVPIARYFWITNDINLVIKYSWWPNFGVSDEIFWHIPFLFYIGFVTCIGIILSVPYLIFCTFVILRHRFQKQNSDFIQLLYGGDNNRFIKEYWTIVLLLVFVIISLLLSLGPDGIIGGWLYNLPVYNWFRHSIKWAIFFQQWSVFCGFFVLDRIILNFAPKKFNLLIELDQLRIHSSLNKLNLIIEIGLLIVTIVLIFKFITIVNNPKRLTDVTLPIQKPEKAVTQDYRYISIWNHGELYKTDIPARILGHNYATIWQLPTLSGYEPMISTKNLKVAQDNWFPGYYTDAETIDLMAMELWGVRYIRIPNGQEESILAILNRRFPDMDIVDYGYDAFLKSNILEIRNSRKVIFSDNSDTLIEKIKIKDNTVSAEVTTINPSLVFFTWTYNKNFVVYSNEKKILVEQDSYGRSFVRLVQPGKYVLKLIYQPAIENYFKIDYLLIILVIFFFFCYELISFIRKYSKNLFMNSHSFNQLQKIMTRKIIAELIRYSVVGGIAVLIDAGVYYMLISYQITSPLIAKRISFVLGSIWSFVANKYFTFKRPEKKISEPILFAILYFSTFIINGFIHDLILNTLNSELFAFMFATITSTILNYLGQKWIIFREGFAKTNGI